MTPAALALLALVFGLLAFDVATLRGRGRPMLVVQATVFVAGAFLIARPETATRLAHAVGIGRGVDFVLYPLVIWLVRESLAHRRQRWEDGARLTHVVRAMALGSARAHLAAPVPTGASSSEGQVPQSRPSSPSPSRTA